MALLAKWKPVEGSAGCLEELEIVSENASEDNIDFSHIIDAGVDPCSGLIAALRYQQVGILVVSPDTSPAPYAILPAGPIEPIEWIADLRGPRHVEVMPGTMVVQGQSCIRICINPGPLNYEQVPQDVSVQAMCLDRDGSRVICAEKNSDDHARIVSRPVVGMGAFSDFAPLFSAGAAEVTSLACIRRSKILLTSAKSHAVHIYEDGKLLQVVGSATEKGCMDGLAADARLLLPQLIQGADAAFILSGTSIMRLGMDSSFTVAKAGSAKNELFMTDDDCGSPEPETNGVIGVHGCSLFAVVQQSFFDPYTIRRLQLSLELPKGKGWPRYGDEEEADEVERKELTMEVPTSGVGATIHGADGSIWGTVVADAGKVWKLESGRIAKKASEGTSWHWGAGSHEASAVNKPLPSNTHGVGGQIRGADGHLWGTVVEDLGSRWKLDNGRTAKKKTVGATWHWDSCRGIGGLIRGADSALWGTVVADEGSVWRLDTGRVAKKVTEGAKWHWETDES